MRFGLLLLACTGCLQDRLIPCGTLLCPLDATCMTDRCVPDEVLAACRGQTDGADCTTSALAHGACSSGECVEPGCGNGVVEGAEICDDRNTISGDGCAGDCSAIDTCPPLGNTPQFSALVHRALVQRCSGYATTEAGDRAIAVCEFVDGPDMLEHGVALGDPDQPLASAGLELGNAEARDAVLAPEGDELFVLWLDRSTGGVTIHVYGAAAGAWIDRGVLPMPFAIDQGTALGTPSRGPARRMMVTGGFQGGIVHEIEIRDTTATELAPPAISPNKIRANLSPDGLRVVGSDLSDGPFYTDRETTDTALRALVTPTGVPAQSTPTMTANCERLYFDGFDSVLYVVQR